MRVTRWAAYAASASLALTGIAAAAAPAGAAATDPIGVTAGADWLTGQLTDGLVHNPNYGGFDDYGLTIDVAFALDAVGRDATVDSIASALSSKVQAYTQYANYPSGTPHTSGAGLAKIGVLADIVGDPASYGGHDLVSETAARISTTAPIAGRLEDAGVETGNPDYSNVLGQAYAVRLLTAAGNAKAASARGFLLDQQCPDGGFRLSFNSDKTAPGQSCTGNTQDDIDATSIVVAQLATLPSNNAVDTALTQARTWIASVQHTDGSWEGTGPTAASNSNSTGLAATALSTGGTTYAAEVAKAATWLRDRQVTYYDVCDKLLRERGAVAYNDAALSTGRDEGITSGTQDQWRRATAQVVPALQFLPVDPTPSDPQLSAPTGYQRSGSQITLDISGVHSGDKLCLNSGTSLLRQFTASGTVDHEFVVLPGRSGHFPYAVRDEAGHASQVTIGALAEKTLTVARTPGEVRRGGTITAAVHGLAPNEPAKIYYGYDLVRSGTASASGNFVAYIPAGTTLGRQYIRGYGQFGDIRKGYTTVTVVR